MQTSIRVGIVAHLWANQNGTNTIVGTGKEICFKTKP